MKCYSGSLPKGPHGPQESHCTKGSITLQHCGTFLGCASGNKEKLDLDLDLNLDLDLDLDLDWHRPPPRFSSSWRVHTNLRNQEPKRAFKKSHASAGNAEDSVLIVSWAIGRRCVAPSVLSHPDTSHGSRTCILKLSWLYFRMLRSSFAFT